MAAASVRMLCRRPVPQHICYAVLGGWVAVVVSAYHDGQAGRPAASAAHNPAAGRVRHCVVDDDQGVRLCHVLLHDGFAGSSGQHGNARLWSVASSYAKDLRLERLVNVEWAFAGACQVHELGFANSAVTDNNNVCHQDWKMTKKGLHPPTPTPHPLFILHGSPGDRLRRYYGVR